MRERTRARRAVEFIRKTYTKHTQQPAQRYSYLNNEHRAWEASVTHTNTNRYPCVICSHMDRDRAKTLACDMPWIFRNEKCARIKVTLLIDIEFCLITRRELVSPFQLASYLCHSLSLSLPFFHLSLFVCLRTWIWWTFRQITNWLSEWEKGSQSAVALILHSSFLMYHGNIAAVR